MAVLDGHVQIQPPPSKWLFPSARDLARVRGDYVATGADLEPGTLLAAYRAGVFPMPGDHGEIDWFSPRRRGVLPVEGFVASRSLRSSYRKFEVRVDTAFQEVMEACGSERSDGNWITPEFVDAYERLFALGWASSVETWRDGELVGGLYGVRIGRLFAGESMFFRAPDASKVALMHLVQSLPANALIDTQWSTPHLSSLGVVEIPRVEYLTRLASALAE